MNAKTFTIFGLEESPYSVKVRSYFRYKGIPHEWLSRGANPELYSKHARLPLVPLVVTPEDRGIQDSTPIIETLEERFSEPSIYPEDPICKFVSALIEEFGDEWGNKWMFHFRWARPIDQIGCAGRIGIAMNLDATYEQLMQIVQQVRSRMVDRVWFVGSNEITAPQIESSFADCMKLLDNHLTNRLYLFGGRPSIADFSLWGQIYNCNRDFTPASILNTHSNVLAWVGRMLNPNNEGEFESWDTVSETIKPILTSQLAHLFLPWDVANENALKQGHEEFDVSLASGQWRQKPQKYHARSFNVLREKYNAVSDNGDLNAVLTETDCLQYLAA